MQISAIKSTQEMNILIEIYVPIWIIAVNCNVNGQTRNLF